MSDKARTPTSPCANAAFPLLCVLLLLLWAAGGASRGEEVGQVIVRAGAWASLICAILLGVKPKVRKGRPMFLLLLAGLTLVLLQLMPLPPGVWQVLPGRAGLAEAAAATAQAQPWRPLAIVPGAAMNAASSLIVPLVVLILAAALHHRDRSRLPGLLLGLVLATTLVGLLQVSGLAIDNPFINDTADQISGSFANRNHFALFLALGCLIAPVWAFDGRRRPGWRAPAALGLVLLFVLTILASGSRAGMFVAMLAVAIGLLLAREGIRHEVRHAPGWVPLALMAAIAAVIAGAILLSVAADRAISIDRALAVDAGQDMRLRGLPTVLALIHIYFPVGSGFGGFDRVFIMHEPLALLKPTYFNHAHNDFLETMIDGGIAGAALLAAAIGWWGVASIRAWRRDTGVTLARLGSAMLLLIAVASLVDYPARTPMIMAIAAIAGVWLCTPTRRGTPSA